MNFRLLLAFALVACILVSVLDAKSLGKHKKHSKKHHVKHAKKQTTPDQGATPQGDDAAAGDDEGTAPAPAPATGGDSAGDDSSDDAAAGTPAAQPQAGGQQQQNNINDANGNGIDDSQEQQQQQNQNDVNQNGIDDRLEGQQQPPAPQAPAAEEEEGSASGPPSALAQTAKIPVLLGGHMRPGPTAETLPAVAARYCDEPCPQTCAPACYDWCCYPSVQVPTPPVQIMMVPLNNAATMPATPGPLQYPMNYVGANDATCSPLPCSSKKQVVAASKGNETLPIDNLSASVINHNVLNNTLNASNNTLNASFVKKHHISKKHLKTKA